MTKISESRRIPSKRVQRTVYIPKQFYLRLEKYKEPHKSITTAIQKVLDMAEGGKVLVVVIQGRKIHCNKMKKISQPNKVFCKMLGTIASLDYCREKCLAAPIVKEVLEKSKSDNEAEIVPLEKFLPPKIEHLRNPPKIGKGLSRPCWVFGVFLGF